ncbi:hypothetical protein DJ90_3407 [Paenibacillus macerans]|uniref:Uncharacterized protein n=1 Tax=Paenibacillus macerans TaxID=44252 RepID=A0A090ZBY2_PAEMA|nr:hypothetical protein DJ90_3407 [Paenibacillus macerans]
MRYRKEWSVCHTRFRAPHNGLFCVVRTKGGCSFIAGHAVI